MKIKIKNFFKKISDKFLYGNYSKNIYIFENKKISIVDYILKFLLIWLVLFLSLMLIFTNFIYSIVISLIITIFMINRIILNAKKIEYQYYILSQLSIYVSQVSMFVNYNNVYTALKETIRFLGTPLKEDLQKVIDNIANGMNILDSFKSFNEKYNNKTITLFNQSLDLFDNYGSSDASNVLQIISEELNDLKIKKDKFYKFKKEWRLNFYVVVFICLSMPILLKITMPDIYLAFMNSFGSMVMAIIMLINLFIINKVEKVYSDLSIGEEGYR